MIETIPFEVLKIEGNNYHPVVYGIINGSSATFILDTGASSTVIDKSVAALGTVIEPHENQEVYAAGIEAQKIDVECVELPSLQLGEVQFSNIRVYSADLKPISMLYQELSGMRIDGLLGCDFMVDNHATVDFVTKTIQIDSMQLP